MILDLTSDYWRNGLMLEAKESTSLKCSARLMGAKPSNALVVLELQVDHADPTMIRAAVSDNEFRAEFQLPYNTLKHGAEKLAGAVEAYIERDGNDVVIESSSWRCPYPIRVQRSGIQRFVEHCASLNKKD